jgi:hypothetical protein
MAWPFCCPAPIQEPTSLELKILLRNPKGFRSSVSETRVRNQVLEQKINSTLKKLKRFWKLWTGTRDKDYDEKVLLHHSITTFNLTLGSNTILVLCEPSDLGNTNLKRLTFLP